MLALMARGATLVGAGGLIAGCAGGGLESTAALPTAPAPGKPADGAPPASGEVVKAALLLPLGASLQMSLVAKGLQQAAELALFERNVPSLQLLVRDDKGTPEGAAAAARSAIADGAEIILGPLLGTSVQAVAPIARAASVPVIAFSNDARNGGQGVHLLSFFPAAEAARVAGHAVANGHRHLAALIPSDSLGEDTGPAFRRAVEAGGGRIAIIETYPADLTGMMEPVQRVMEAIQRSGETEHPIDGLFLPSSVDNVPRLISVLRHHRVEAGRMRLLVTSGWDNPQALSDPRISGAWLAAPEPRGWAELSSRFAKAYNAMPPRLASLAYDAVSVAGAFATQAKGQRYTAANLTRTGGFAGVDGPFRLSTDGPIERSLAIHEIKPQGLVVIDPAAGFTPGTTGAPMGALGAAPAARG